MKKNKYYKELNEKEFCKLYNKLLKYKEEILGMHLYSFNDAFHIMFPIVNWFTFYDRIYFTEEQTKKIHLDIYELEVF